MINNSFPPTPRKLAAACLLAGLTSYGSAALAQPAVVTNGLDSGMGSLRDALASGAREIVIATVDDIQITSALVYDGERPLSIDGTGSSRIVADGDYDILRVSNGANLTVIGVDFVGPGGFDINNQSMMMNPGKGIFVDVRDNQTGTVKLVLKDVSVSGVANHGVHVSDCDLADDCGAGGGGAGGGSPSRIVLEFSNVTIDNVGNGKFDADGLRVDERGPGGIKFTADTSSFTGVGADGVELDEGGQGNVIVNVSGSTFSNNGEYCNPAILEPFLPIPPEDEDIPDGQVTESGIVPVGTPDDRCFEVEFDTYQSGFVSEYEVAIDVDDGFDVDEEGAGIISTLMVGSNIDDNFDEGVDFDEEGPGAIRFVAVNSGADNNVDDGFKFSEEDQGSVKAVFLLVEALNNGGKGIVLEEADQGSLEALVEQSTTSGNDDGDVGIEAVQEDGGSGVLTVRNSTVSETDENNGIEVDGVDLVVE